MGLAKKETQVPTAPSGPKDSGTDAAIERLKKASIPEGHTSPLPYKQRDFDAEARGKTRCVMFAAALGSPALAGLPFKSLGEFLSIAREAADAGVKYSFND
jgi:hypothetical protein